MSKYSARAKKRVTQSYGSGGSSGSSSSGSSGSSSTRRPIDYSSIGGSSSGGSSQGTASGGASNPYEEASGAAGSSGSGQSNAGGGNSNSKYSYTYRGEYDNYREDDDDGGFSMQVSALQSAMNNNREALQKAYDASAGELNDATAASKRQAYLNQQRALKTLPQTMAAAGYNGGVTETTAANIANEYQNALNDIDRSRAQELARLQANLANGIAESDTRYQIQIANALQAAEQYERQQEQWAEELALRQRAAAFEEQKYQDSLNRARSSTGSEGGSSSKNASPSTLLMTPGSYLDAQRQAQASSSLDPIAAYLKGQGLSDNQIAARMNELTLDPESAFYRYR